MSIAKNIKKRRLELGLTLKQVADSLGVAESTISRYESNEIRNMGIDKIETLAQTLKTSPSYLLGWTEADPFYQADIDDLNSVFEDYGLRIALVDPDDPDWAVFYWNGSKYEFTRIPLEEIWDLYSDLEHYSEEDVAYELGHLYKKHTRKENRFPNSIDRTLSALYQLNEEGQEKVAGYAEDLHASGKYDRKPKVITFREKSEDDPVDIRIAAYSGEELTDDQREEALRAREAFREKQEKNKK